MKHYVYLYAMAVAWTAAVLMGYHEMEHSGWALFAAVLATLNYPNN